MLTTMAATLGLLTTASAAVAQQGFETLDADGDSYPDADELAEWVDDEGMFLDEVAEGPDVTNWNEDWYGAADTTGDFRELQREAGRHDRSVTPLPRGD